MWWAADGAADKWWAVLLFFLALASVRHSQLRYQIEYPNHTVTMLDRPRDCDFWKAPVGDKECRYDREVIEDSTDVTVTWIKVD